MTIPTLLMLLKSHSLVIRTPVKIPHQVLYNDHCCHDAVDSLDGSVCRQSLSSPLTKNRNHPIFNSQNDLLNSQNKLMEQMTTLRDLVGQVIQKKEEEKRIAEEQAAKDRYWKISHLLR
ncbi:hypothetical protein Tco_1421196 [Tanacetum coccineum]